MSADYQHISKFLSYVLRHHPESIGLEVDAKGWAHLPSLIKKARQHGEEVDRNTIERLMEQSNKKRFSLSEDGEYIRAGYGHSIEVDLGLKPQQPPEVLYHGTAQKNLPSINKTGINAQNRQLVHLSVQQSEAEVVGSRHGNVVILAISAYVMYEKGFTFYQSDSEPGIWLVDQVPPDFIRVT